MDTHAAPAPRRRTLTRLKWAAILVAAPALIIFGLVHAVTLQDVSDATKRLRHPDPAVRAAAVKKLGGMRSSASSAIPTLLDLLRNDDNGEVWSEVVDALWEIGPDTGAGVVWLNARLKDPDPAVRTHAAFVLGSHRPHWSLDLLRLRRPWVREAVAALSEAVRDEDKIVRWMAVTGIMRYAGPYATEAVPALIQAMDDDSDGVRRHAAIALSRIGPPAHPAIPALVREIRRPYPAEARTDADHVRRTRAHMVKLHAGIGLGRIGPRAIPEVVNLLKDPAGREYAFHAFPGVGVEALPHLVGLLRDPDAAARQGAAQVIGAYGAAAAAAVPNLISALNDPDGDVRTKAALALGHIGPAAERAVPPLVASLGDQKSYFGPLYALGEIGPRAADAVPALLAFIGDERRPEYVRAYAVIALLKIAPEAKASVPPRLVEAAEVEKKSLEADFERHMKDAGTNVNPLYR